MEGQKSHVEFRTWKICNRERPKPPTHPKQKDEAQSGRKAANRKLLKGISIYLVHMKFDCPGRKVMGRLHPA
jgi:hypothetical protein